ncbi:hypothetical protein [Sulfurimonas sp.]
MYKTDITIHHIFTSPKHRYLELFTQEKLDEDILRPLSQPRIPQMISNI